MHQNNYRPMAPVRKHAVWKPAKKIEMVRLLMKDDEKKFLTESQRTDLLTIVGKQYASEKKKAALANKEKVSLAAAVAQGMSMDEIVQGIKQKWITIDTEE